MSDLDKYFRKMLKKIEKDMYFKANSVLSITSSVGGSRCIESRK